MRVRGYRTGNSCWANVATAEPAVTQSFYGRLFGWKTRPGGAVDGYDIFYKGDFAVAGIRPAETGPGWLPHLATENLDECVATVGAAGGRVLVPTTKIGSAGRGAIVVDTVGAPLGLWQRDRFYGAQLILEFGAVCWTDLATHDGATATAFYRKVFGWTDHPGEFTGLAYTEFHDPGGLVGGMITAGSTFPPEAPSHWTVTFMVEDCAATAQHARELGGEVLIRPTALAPATFASLADPHGAMFRVVELEPEILALL